MHRAGPFWLVQTDRLEWHLQDGEYAWEAGGWYGYDEHRLAWKTEGEGEGGDSPDSAELQLLYSRLFAPYWEWQVGVRHDARPANGQNFFVAGIHGVAPYEFDIDAALFIGEGGDVRARFEAEYELLLTQRLVLEPSVEIDVALRDAPEYGVDRGISATEVGLRLRYEIRREFAPYLGLEWAHHYGLEGDLLESAGKEDASVSVLAGVRFWF